MVGGTPPWTSSTLLLSLAFVAGVAIRLLPEILAGPDAVLGYDLVAYYAPVLYHKGFVFSDWRVLFASPNYSPLIYVTLLWAPRGFVFVSLRAVAVILYGLLSAGIFFFAEKRIGLEPKWAFFASIFICLQLPTLRIGWDLLKNTLALVFALIILSGRFAQSSRLLRSLAAALALTHQLVAVIVAAILGLEYIRGAKSLDLRGHERNACAQNLVIMTALIILGAVLGSGVLGFPGPGTVYYLPVGAKGTSLEPVANYLAVYSSYNELARSVVYLGGFLFLPLFLFAVVGMKKERTLLGWAGITGLAGFSPLVSPTLAAGFWYRWLFLLVFPLGLYGVLGIRRILASAKSKRAAVFMLILILVPFIWLAGNFLLVPPEDANPYFGNPAILAVFPSSMLQNTVPLNDAKDVEYAVRALDRLMTVNSVCLTHESFFGWVSIGLTGNKTIIDYLLGTPEDAVPLAKSLGFKTIYWIWWTPEISWHNYSASAEIFKPVYVSGRIAVYVYVGS